MCRNCFIIQTTRVTRKNWNKQALHINKTEQPTDEKKKWTIIACSWCTQRFVVVLYFIRFSRLNNFGRFFFRFKFSVTKITSIVDDGCLTDYDDVADQIDGENKYEQLNQNISRNLTKHALIDFVFEWWENDLPPDAVAR